MTSEPIDGTGDGQVGPLRAGRHPAAKARRVTMRRSQAQDANIPDPDITENPHALELAEPVRRDGMDERGSEDTGDGWQRIPLDII